MSNYVTLLGSERVESASYTMQRAADQMQQAANQFDNSVHLLLRGLDERLAHLESLLVRGEA